MSENNIGTVKRVNYADETDEVYVPSHVQADTLFSFTTKLEYLTSTIKNKMISPRYCEENIEYLQIDSIKSIAIPMKCFCDINLHMIKDHLAYYGYYGIAFEKEWGIRNGIQPVQYINPNSPLCKDFSEAFAKAIANKSTEKDDDLVNQLEDYLLHELFFYKPYSGKSKDRVTGDLKPKCFTEECEWRFVPQVEKAGYQQLFTNPVIIKGKMDYWSNSMEGVMDVSLPFEYEDIKYIILKEEADFSKFLDTLSQLGIEKAIEQRVISKVIIWEKSKGDF